MTDLETINDLNKKLFATAEALGDCFKRREEIELAARHVYLTSKSKPLDPELYGAMQGLGLALNRYGTKREIDL